MSRGESAQEPGGRALPAPGSGAASRRCRLTPARLWLYIPRDQGPAHWRRAFAVIPTRAMSGGPMPHCRTEA